MGEDRLDQARAVSVRYFPRPDIGPVEEAVSYVRHQWFQQLIPARTTCYRCKAVSPVVHVPYGTIAFDDPKMLKRGNYLDLDITRDVVMAFGTLGWKFQLRRSYCPTCKNLGSI